MKVVKVSGVEIIANDVKVLEYVAGILTKVSEHRYPAFEIDFFWLERVVFFDNYEALRSYEVEHGKEIVPRRNWDESNGCYEPRHRAIYLFNSSEVMLGGGERIATTLLHELSHYIMDTYDLLSRTRYVEDPMYRYFEEIRVNNMSFYLAKPIFGEATLIDFKYYVKGYREFMLRLISQVKNLGYEKKYLEYGRGVASLMQMGDYDL